MGVDEGHGPPRVVLGNLEPVVALGLTAVLREDGIEVIGVQTRAAALVLTAANLRPDAVVLDLDRPASRRLGDRVRVASPETTIIFWARDEDVMEVVDPGTSDPRRVLTPEPEELRGALVRSHRCA